MVQLTTVFLFQLNNEFALGRLFCRKAYSSILRFTREDNFPETGNFGDAFDDSAMAASVIHSNVLLLREFDLENLTFLVEDNYCRTMCSLVNLEDNNLESNSAVEILSRNSKNLLKAFLVDTKTIDDEVRLMLEENQLNQETFERFFDFLEFPASHFTTEEIVINDVSMLSSVVRFDAASFVVVSCRFDRDSKEVPEEMKVQIRSLPPTSPCNSSGELNFELFDHF